jgi:hypothetical protein
MPLIVAGVQTRARTVHRHGPAPGRAYQIMGLGPLAGVPPDLDMATRF